MIAGCHTYQSRLQGATFILANGDHREAEDLLDRHIADLQEREAEAIEMQYQEQFERDAGSEGVTDWGLEM